MNRQLTWSNWVQSTTAVAVATLCGSQHAIAQATFHGLGPLPNGHVAYVNAVSGDGNVLVGGSSNGCALYWSQATGFVEMSPTCESSHAAGASHDGSIIVGQVLVSGRGRQAFRWTASTGMVPIFDSSLGFFESTATGISADGNFIVGFYNLVGQPPVAFRWSVAGGLLNLPTLPGSPTGSRSLGVSNDGSVVVGSSATSSCLIRPFKWTAGAMLDLGNIPGGPCYGQATAVSADGSVVVGRSAGVNGFEPIRWTASSGIESLGPSPANPPPSSREDIATAVSGDGRVIVGYYRAVGQFGPTVRPFVWDIAHGMRDLKNLLTNDYGIDLSAWGEMYPTGISDDGLTIVGSGDGPEWTSSEGWIATFPTLDLDTDGDGLLDTWETDGIPYVDSFGATQLYVLDADGDGITECDPQHKDLFVEVDAMMGLTPAAAALSRVVNAFAAAPASNPDGATGVALHYVLDDTNIPNAGWTLDDTNADGVADWPTEFDALKLTASSGTTLAGYFGTTIERNDPDAAGIRGAKSKAYRYCIFARQQDPGNFSSGLAELPGNDFIVTLGVWNTPGGTTDQQAGTFMHELGHTLGLGHGGRAPGGTPDHINYKPNYHSIMSYSWQLPMPWMAPGSWPLDGARSGYSEFAVSTILNEAAADDCLPALVVPGSSLAGVRYQFNTHNDGTIPADVRLGRFDLATDWRNDSTQQCGAEALPVDLTRINTLATPNQTLHGRDDWAVIVYDFKTSASFPPGVHNPDLGAAEMIELDYPTHLALSQLFPPFCGSDVNNDRTVNVTDLLAVIGGWGACPQGCLADIAPSPTDGQVNVTDLLAVIGGWGPCP